MMADAGDGSTTGVEGKGIMKALLNSMWGYWFFLLVISFGLASGIYFIWLRGNL
jgi:hypothetical protein